MNPGTWQGVLFWVIGVGLFWAGSKWGRARERSDQLIRDIQKHTWDQR